MNVMCWYDLFVIRWPVFFISVLRMQELSLRVCVVSLTQLFLWPPSSALPNYTPCLFDERRQRTMVEWCTFNWALSVIDVLYYRPHPLFSIWTLKGIVHPKNDSFRRNNQGTLLPYHECSRRSDMTQCLKVVPSYIITSYLAGDYF